MDGDSRHSIRTKVLAKHLPESGVGRNSKISQARHANRQLSWFDTGSVTFVSTHNTQILCDFGLFSCRCILPSFHFHLSTFKVMHYLDLERGPRVHFMPQHVRAINSHHVGCNSKLGGKLCQESIHVVMCANDSAALLTARNKKSARQLELGRQIIWRGPREWGCSELNIRESVEKCAHGNASLLSTHQQTTKQR